jgi:hypothetical protein
VVGFVETDGALGTLVTANITDWKLTLTAPNLLDGPINVIDFAAHIQSSVMGNALTATPTQLLFNFDSPGNAFFSCRGSYRTATTGVSKRNCAFPVSAPSQSAGLKMAIRLLRQLPEPGQW